MATFDEALNFARQSLAAGRFAQAEPVYRQLLAAAPGAAPLWHELGILQLQSGALDAARQSLERAIQLEGGVAAFHSNLGAVYRQMKRPADAVACFRRAVELGPPTAELYSNLALALKAVRREDEALAVYDRALALREDYANGHFNRGNLLLDVGRIEEAIAAYRRTIELAPQDAGAWSKLGVAYNELADTDAALACFDRALEIQPTYPEVRRSRGVIWLARGEYFRGWQEAEYRLQCNDYPAPQYSAPRWTGEPLAGRSVFLYSEQGLGDTLHFLRYVPLAQQRGGRVMLGVQSPLVPLVRQSGYGDLLVEPGVPLAFDLQCPLMSLPMYLPNGRGEPYWNGAYLRASPGLVSAWDMRLAALEGFKVGIAWGGNPDHPSDRFRSVHLRQFAPLAAIPGVRLVSLQQGPPRAQIAEVAADFEVIDLGDDFDRSAGAFMDTAAVMQHLDLIVTIDTSIAHLAGGLGRAAWVLLQLSPDWRWGLSGDSAPWYPALRLFRQPRFGDWDSVVNRVAAELRQTTGERNSRGE